MDFEFATAGRIMFGPGRVLEAGKVAAGMGRKALVVSGLGCDRCTGLLAALDAAGREHVFYAVDSEPTIEAVQAGVALGRQAGCDLVIGFGGGSAIDAGKAIAAMLTNPGELPDYLEVIGRGKSLTVQPLPFIAIPTTAGTGAEVTRNAVVSSPEQAVKVSLRSPLMLPRVALVDPELTYSLPPNVTASTGMDALTQLVEPYVSNRPNPLTDAICREGMARAARSLQRAYEQGDDAEARQDMAIASLFGGLALANAKLGAVHGFAAPLGGMFPAPHGALCARLLPIVMETNVATLRKRSPEASALGRYTEVARILTGDPGAEASDGVVWVGALAESLSIPPLSRYGMRPEHLPEAAAKAAQASSMAGNPITLTIEELISILEQAL